jgi:hypothetical protein
MLIIVLQKDEFSMNSRHDVFFFVRPPDQVFNLKRAIQDCETGVQFSQHLWIPGSDHAVDNPSESRLLSKWRGLYLFKGPFHWFDLRILKETRQPYSRNYENINHLDVEGETTNKMLDFREGVPPVILSIGEGGSLPYEIQNWRSQKPIAMIT